MIDEIDAQRWLSYAEADLCAAEHLLQSAGFLAVERLPEKRPMMNRLQFLYWAAWEAGTNWIGPLGYTSEEIESASSLSLPGETRERGVVVYEAKLMSRPLAKGDR